MENLSKEIKHQIEELKKACQKNKMRLTNQRIEIYKEVAKSKAHPDAEVIFKAVRKNLPNISIDTVYRTLLSLEDLDMIFRVDNQLPKARFDADKTPHHHFLCTKCNQVFDIFIDKKDQIKIPKKSFELGDVKGVNLQIRGICNNCKKQ